MEQLNLRNVVGDDDDGIETVTWRQGLTVFLEVKFCLTVFMAIKHEVQQQYM